MAANEGHVNIAKELIARKAELDPLSSLQRTPLMQAALRGHVDICRLLTDTLNVNINAKD